MGEITLAAMTIGAVLVVIASMGLWDQKKGKKYMWITRKELDKKLLNSIDNVFDFFKAELKERDEAIKELRERIDKLERAANILVYSESELPAYMSVFGIYKHRISVAEVLERVLERLNLRLVRHVAREHIDLESTAKDDKCSCLGTDVSCNCNKEDLVAQCKPIKGNKP